HDAGSRPDSALAHAGPPLPNNGASASCQARSNGPVPRYGGAVVIAAPIQSADPYYSCPPRIKQARLSTGAAAAQGSPWERTGSEANPEHCQPSLCRLQLHG